MTLRAVALAMALLAAPEIAMAHGSIEGMGSFYGGMLHPFLVPAHVLVLAALGLFLGQNAWFDLPVGMPAFLAAIVIGLATAGFAELAVPMPLLLGLATLLGGLIAAAPTLPSILVAPITVTVGLLVAVDSTPDLPTIGARAAALAGTGLTAMLVVFYAASFAERLRSKEWQRVLVRVLGSWMAASAVLVLALVIAGKA